MNEIKDLKERIVEIRQFKSTIKPPFPKDMMVELANGCNHNCIFCTNHKATRKVGSIDSGLLYRLLHEAHLLGTTDVGFYTTGEPFLSRKLSQYVAEAKKIGFKYVYISTNGALASPERSTPVIEAGLDSIKFSINAGTPHTYKIIHGRDDFNTVLNNLKFISEYRKKLKNPLRIYVTYVITKQNQNECKTLKSLISSFVDDFFFQNITNQGNMISDANQSLGVEGENMVRRPPCSIVFNRFHITYEGYLTICCVDYQNYMVVADLNTTSLKNAWHNEAFVEIRRRHLMNKLKGTLCYNCLFNKNKQIEPLMPQYATVFDKKTP